MGESSNKGVVFSQKGLLVASLEFRFVLSWEWGVLSLGAGQEGFKGCNNGRMSVCAVHPKDEGLGLLQVGALHGEVGAVD